MLLEWLDPDRERAGYRYEEIRRKLMKIFTLRGCPNAEDLADVTIDRVIRKISEISHSYSGDPALFFYGVAQHVYSEHLKQKSIPASPISDVAEASNRIDVHFECLDRCLEHLSPASRDLITLYYQEEKGRNKVDARKRLAHELGISVNVLRIRIHRIRNALMECMMQCMKEPNR